MLEKKGLVKLAEECGELVQIACKKMTCMDNDFHYDGSDLATRLEEEMGDVLAAMNMVIEGFDLNNNHIEARAEHKTALFREWLLEKR